MIFNQTNSSGGGAQTVFVTVGPSIIGSTFYYTDADMNVQTTNSKPTNVEMPIGTIIFAYGRAEPDPVQVPFSHCSALYTSSTYNCAAFVVTETA